MRNGSKTHLLRPPGTRGRARYPYPVVWCGLAANKVDRTDNYNKATCLRCRKCRDISESRY